MSSDSQRATLLSTLLAAVALAGCGGSPCTGNLADNSGECAESCPGLSVSRVTPSCGVAPVVWCIPELRRVDTGVDLYLRNTETGDTYITQRLPDLDYAPAHIRAATQAERDAARTCSTP